MSIVQYVNPPPSLPSPVPPSVTGRGVSVTQSLSAPEGPTFRNRSVHRGPGPDWRTTPVSHLSDRNPDPVPTQSIPFGGRTEVRGPGNKIGEEGGIVTPIKQPDPEVSSGQYLVPCPRRSDSQVRQWTPTGVARLLWGGRPDPLESGRVVSRYFRSSPKDPDALWSDPYCSRRTRGG